MPLETAQYIHQLNPANPASADRLQQGDDHIRMVKSALKATFPKIDAPLDASAEFLNKTVPAGLVPFGIITLFFGDTAPTGWAICNGQTVEKSDGTGNVVLPDLRGRVGVGVSDKHAKGSTWGQESRTVTSEAGGAHTHAASSGAAGSHSHGGSTAGHSLTAAQNGPHRHYEFANATGGYDNLQNNGEAAPNRGGGGSSSGASYNIGQSGGEATIGRSSQSGSGEAHAHGIGADGQHSHDITVTDATGHTHAVTVEVSQPSLALHYIMKI